MATTVGCGGGLEKPVHERGKIGDIPLLVASGQAYFGAMTSTHPMILEDLARVRRETFLAESHRERLAEAALAGTPRRHPVVAELRAIAMALIALIGAFGSTSKLDV